MASTSAIITERRRAAACGMVAMAALLAGVAVAHAHPVTPQVVREMVRIQGQRHRGAEPAPAGQREVTFVVLGQRVPFRASGWQVFRVAEVPATPPPERDELTLQGERRALLAITGARPDQRLTILAERRPGAGDLFILAVDRCPE